MECLIGLGLIVMAIYLLGWQAVVGVFLFLWGINILEGR